jgi:hypothetical protein
MIKGIVMAMTSPTTRTIADVVDEGGTGPSRHRADEEEEEVR